jgi:biotin transporter BioY
MKNVLILLLVIGLCLALSLTVMFNLQFESNILQGLLIFILGNINAIVLTELYKNKPFPSLFIATE